MLAPCPTKLPISIQLVHTIGMRIDNNRIVDSLFIAYTRRLMLSVLIVMWALVFFLSKKPPEKLQSIISKSELA